PHRSRAALQPVRHCVRGAARYCVVLLDRNRQRGQTNRLRSARPGVGLRLVGARDPLAGASAAAPLPGPGAGMSDLFASLIQRSHGATPALGPVPPAPFDLPVAAPWGEVEDWRIAAAPQPAPSHA